jgi:hypothetical protein
MSNIILGRLIEDEGYCCMYGYCKLAKSRGETPETMAKAMGVSKSTIAYHYTKIADATRSHRCKQSPDCMKPLFTKP